MLAILLLSQLVLMSSYARHPESEQSILRTWLMTVFTPVVKVADGVISSITGTVASYTDLRGAREENSRLRADVEQLTNELNQLREQKGEYERLKAQINLPSHPQYRAIAANVFARDTKPWFKRLTIDRGSLDGVKRDMPVITAAGIVGRIINVGPNHSVVQVITDRYAGVGAMLQNSRSMGEVRGLDPEARCELKNIRSTEEVQIGETVVTTGLDRIYPKGLMIGQVERVESDPHGPWHKIILLPSASIDRVEQVMVLLVEQKDIETEETNR